MQLLFFCSSLALISLVINSFLPDRFRWRKTAILILGLLGLGGSFIQGYWGIEKMTALQQQQEYFDEAKYDALGLTGLAGTGLKETTPINTMIETYVRRAPVDQSQNIYLLQWNCSNQAMSAYQETINVDVKFPFVYIYKAGCEYLHKSGDWQTDLNKAREILLITTTIPHHQKNHDDSLKGIESGSWKLGAGG
jgi:hypothetical protein